MHRSRPNHRFNPYYPIHTIKYIQIYFKINYLQISLTTYGKTSSNIQVQAINKISLQYNNPNVQYLSRAHLDEIPIFPIQQFIVYNIHSQKSKISTVHPSPSFHFKSNNPWCTIFKIKSQIKYPQYTLLHLFTSNPTMYGVQYSKSNHK